MTVVSNNPSWWPIINSSILYSYCTVAAGLVVVYDWVLTLGQEIDLIWIRYVGIPYSVVSILQNITFLSLTDAGCNIINYATNGTEVVVTAMLSVIMIVRLHAMYQRSRRMLIFLAIIFLAVNIACVVISIIALKYEVAWEEVIISGIHMCGDELEGNVRLLLSMIWMLSTVWELLTLCLSVWIATKHFRDLRRLGPLAGSTIGEYFRVLMKSHVLYFASFAGVSSFQFVDLSPVIKNLDSIAGETLNGTSQILLFVQMFVLGPRLILSVRQYHAKLVAESDAETSMNSIVFQELVHVPTSSTV